MRPDFRRKPELTPVIVPTLDEQRFTLGKMRDGQAYVSMLAAAVPR